MKSIKIPKNEAMSILKAKIKIANISYKIEIIEILNIPVKQNFFAFNEKNYKLNDGLPMIISFTGADTLTMCFVHGITNSTEIIASNTRTTFTTTYHSKWRRKIKTLTFQKSI